MKRAQRSKSATRKSPRKVAKAAAIPKPAKKKVAAAGREAAPPEAFSSEDVAQMLKLLKGASSVELKLSVPAELLTRPGPLDEEEWKLMKLHPELGAMHICELELASRLPSGVKATPCDPAGVS